MKIINLLPMRWRAAAQRTAARLVDESVLFHCEPLPDGLWLIGMRPDAFAHFLGLAKVDQRYRIEPWRGGFRVRKAGCEGYFWAPRELDAQRYVVTQFLTNR